jgi:hypothetical protein
LAKIEKSGKIWETLMLPPIAEEGDPLGRKLPGEFPWDDDGFAFAGLFAARMSMLR